MGTKCKCNIMLNLQILRICQVFNMEKFLNLMNALLCKVYDLIFFIFNEVTKLYEACDILAQQLERGEASHEMTKMAAIMGEEVIETGDFVAMVTAPA